MAAAVASFYFILLLTISYTIAFPSAECPESAAATIFDSPPLIPSAEPVMNSNKDNILPEAPLLPPPAQIAAAPAQQETGPTATDGGQPLTQPSASTDTASSRTKLNGNGNQEGEQLGYHNQGENTSSNSGLAGAGAVGGGVMAEPLVDNTPFDSGSSTSFWHMGISPYTAVILWILI